MIYALIYFGQYADAVAGSRDIRYVLSYYNETYIYMYIPESMPGVKLSKFDKTVSAVGTCENLRCFGIRIDGLTS